MDMHRWWRYSINSLRSYSDIRSMAYSSFPLPAPIMAQPVIHSD